MLSTSVISEKKEPKTNGTEAEVNSPKADALYANMAFQADTQEVIYGNRESNMPQSTAIPIKKLEAYIRKNKREEVPYKTEFKVLLQNIMCATLVSFIPA